ncbi:metallophosphoesterase family protein [Pelagibacterium sediminicola]|uniref:metallophosphoesterase family protein n=1 Tax=Pelagibacterium sediminicola TaxID=2248761 RepID=UPI000E31C646|nr:metallophosphoesterase family protein [Pelagibacterium sediminicola]
MSRVFFTADHHFGHANILRFCDRRFDDIDHHDRYLEQCWNDTVRPEDTVYHLGDFAYRSDKDAARKRFNRLHGTKHLIVGNHDGPWVREMGWETVEKMADISVGGQRIILCHYGLRVWNSMRHGALMLYGHSHSRLPGNSQSCDVGVDDWQFMPVDLPQIRARLATLPKLIVHDDTDESGLDESSGLKV